MPQSAMTYDIENRLVQTVHTANGTEQYVYNPWNERVWRKRTDGYEEVYFYGPDGRRLLRVQLQYDATNGNFHMTNPVAEIRLAGKLVSSGDWRYGLVEDQTGTVSAGIYYPYGESKVSPTTGPWRTYPRDSGSGLDYAMNRYYSSFTGRFTTPDPYGPSGGSADPQSWNRYAYSQNDPVNFLDPNGLQRARVCDSYMDWDSSDGVWRARGSVLWCYEGEVGGGGGRFTPPDAGGGTRNAGASSNATNWDLMPKALARALQVLSLNADCAALFGTAESRANGFDPAVILVTLYASPDGGKYGKTTFADLGLNAEGAYERKRGGKVEIVINSSAPTFHQYWNYGNVELNALLMLHEMGHAYADLTGSGGSQIKRDTDWRDRSTPQGEVNNSLIRTKCHLGEP